MRIIISSTDWKQINNLKLIFSFQNIYFHWPTVDPHIPLTMALVKCSSSLSITSGSLTVLHTWITETVTKQILPSMVSIVWVTITIHTSRAPCLQSLHHVAMSLPVLSSPAPPWLECWDGLESGKQGNPGASSRAGGSALHDQGDFWSSYTCM